MQRVRAPLGVSHRQEVLAWIHPNFGIGMFEHNEAFVGCLAKRHLPRKDTDRAVKRSIGQSQRARANVVIVDQADLGLRLDEWISERTLLIELSFDAVIENLDSARWDKVRQVRSPPAATFIKPHAKLIILRIGGETAHNDKGRFRTSGCLGHFQLWLRVAGLRFEMLAPPAEIEGFDL